MKLFDKTKSHYASIAVLALNTCLLVTAGNVMLFLFYQWMDGDDFYGGQLEPENLEWLEQVYPTLDRQQIIKMVTEKVSRPFVEAQLLGWREAPFTGVFVNVDDNGFRMSRNQAAWPPKREDDLVVFLFGGSTTFGYGVADDETIASQLQLLLELADSETPAIYNFGQGNYYSTQELILFEKLISLGHIPDIAVFIDGLNEFFIPQWPMSEAIPRQSPLRHLALSLPMARAARSVRDRLLNANTSPESSDIETAQSTQAELIDQVLDRYRTTKTMIEAISNAYGIETVFVWQPVPTYKYGAQYHYPLRLSSNPNGFGRLAITQPGYEQMYRVKEEMGYPDSFSWCADIQEGLVESLYVDMWHYSGEMNGKVARCVYDSMHRKDSPDGTE